MTDSGMFWQYIISML